MLFLFLAFSYYNNTFNIRLFTIAPKPASPDVLALSIKDTPTTSQSALDTGAVQTTVTPLPSLNTEGPSSSECNGLTSGAEPEGSCLDVLGELTVPNLTSTTMTLAWSAPDETFDSFLVELNALSGMAQALVTTIPGSVRNAEIDGLSPGTRYDITLHGLVEGAWSLPLRAFATTGTWSRKPLS